MFALGRTLRNKSCAIRAYGYRTFSSGGSEKWPLISPAELRVKLHLSSNQELTNRDHPGSQRTITRPRVIDASWFMGGKSPDGRTAREEYELRRLTIDTIFWDIDEIAAPLEHAQNVPHSLPSIAHMAAALSHFQLHPTDEIVLYDCNNFLASSRLWYTLNYFGCTNVRVLNGGLEAWVESKFDLVNTEQIQLQPIPHPSFVNSVAPLNGYTMELHGREYGKFKVTEEELRNSIKPEMVAALGHMHACVVALGDRETSKYNSHGLITPLPASLPAILDARSQGRFDGTEPEPRPNLYRGHMPGAACVPWTSVVDMDTGKMKSEHELRRIFAKAGLLDIRSREIITTCGSGMTASVLNLALACAGRRLPSALYDYSWMEYGATKHEGHVIAAKGEAWTEEE